MRITTHIIYLAKRTDFEFSKKYAPARRKVEELVTKEAIFHYVDAVPHDPIYREKYALNLKLEVPRIPFYKDFWQWASWGKELMDRTSGTSR